MDSDSNFIIRDVEAENMVKAFLEVREKAWCEHDAEYVSTWWKQQKAEVERLRERMFVNPPPVENCILKPRDRHGSTADRV